MLSYLLCNVCINTACELFDFALKPKEKWALKRAAAAVEALPAAEQSGEGEAAASGAGCCSTKTMAHSLPAAPAGTALVCDP